MRTRIAAWLFACGWLVLLLAACSAPPANALRLGSTSVPSPGRQMGSVSLRWPMTYGCGRRASGLPKRFVSSIPMGLPSASTHSETADTAFVTPNIVPQEE
jgi:hypothetical protein